MERKEECDTHVEHCKNLRDFISETDDSTAQRHSNTYRPFNNDTSLSRRYMNDKKRQKFLSRKKQESKCHNII